MHNFQNDQHQTNVVILLISGKFDETDVSSHHLKVAVRKYMQRNLIRQYGLNLNSFVAVIPTGYFLRLSHEKNCCFNRNT